MKEIVAIIRPEKLEEVKTPLKLQDATV